MKNKESGFRKLEFGMLILMIFAFSSQASAQMELPFFLGEEIIVTAGRISQPRVLSPYSTTLLQQEEIMSLGRKTIGEILYFVPGTDVRTLGYLGALSTASVRIIGTDKTLVLLDGRRLNSPASGNVDLSTLLTADVERIEVIRGPVSSLYGSEAHGGVVQIFTRRPDRPMDLRVNADTGSFGTQQYGISFSDNQILPFRIGTTLLRSDGFRDNSAYAGRQVNLEAETAFLQKGVLTVNLLSYFGEQGVPHVAPPDSRIAATKPRDRQSNDDFRSAITFSLPWNSQSETELKLSYDQSNIIFREEGITFGKGTNGVFTKTVTKGSRLGVQLDQKLHLKHWEGVFGLEAFRDLGEGNAIGLHSFLRYALFSNADIHFTQNSTINLGVRVDTHALTDTAVTPRVGAVLPIADKWFIKTSYAYGFRTPFLNELFWNQPLNQGNPNLRSEYSRNFDLGFRRADQGQFFQVSYFNGEYTDMIFWRSDPVTFITSPQNISRARVQGIELEWDNRWNTLLSTRLNYTLQRSSAEDPTQTVAVSSSEDLIYMPSSKLSAVLSIANPELVNIDVAVRYTGKRCWTARCPRLRPLFRPRREHLILMPH